jgi:predicted nucleic acid-binding protein
MNANSRVVLDACVLANFGLCDLFLTLAETPRLYQPVWNREILDEVQRTQTGKLGWPEGLSKSWREAVESAFPEAMVTVQESLVAACANHEKDRHVLATAIRGHAELILTSNLKHFPPEALKPWDVCACHPADYLITLYSLKEAEADAGATPGVAGQERAVVCRAPGRSGGVGLAGRGIVRRVVEG